MKYAKLFGVSFLATMAGTTPVSAQAAEVRTYLHETVCSLSGQGCTQLFFYMPGGLSLVRDLSVCQNVAEQELRRRTTVLDDGTVWHNVAADCFQSDKRVKGALPMTPG